MARVRHAAAIAAVWFLAAFAAPEAEFSRRVAQYVSLHRKAAKQSQRIRTTGASAIIVNHRVALAREIRVLRAGARRGDIFTPEVEKEFRRAMASPGADLLRAAPPAAEQKLCINKALPAGTPLPPSLLPQLPRLPDELEYCIAARSLVLRDTIANVVVDFIPDLLPAN